MICGRFWLVIFFTLSCKGLLAQEGVVIDKIIAKVDNHIVLKSDLELSYLDLLTKGQITGTERCRVLENLVVSKLLLAKAEIDSITVLDIEVAGSLDRKMRYFISQIGSEEKLEEYYGKSIEQFKEELMEQEKEQILIQRMQEKITSGIKITPAEVRKFFQQIPEDSLPYFSKEVMIGQIVRIPEAGKERKEAAISILRELKTRILEGEDFDQLARKYSQEPGADKSGGRIGFFRRGELAPEYEAAALELNTGEISDPVETSFGIHLIQLLARRGNEFDTRHILLIPRPSPEDIQITLRKLDSIRILIVNDSLAFDKAAKEYSEDKITAANGGFLMDETSSARISVERLDPNTFFTIDTMSVGSITRPFVYESEEGDKAARIVYFKDVLKPHRANLKDDWQKIRTAALNEKKSRILNEWFNQARFEVFISISEDFAYCNILN